MDLKICEWCQKPIDKRRLAWHGVKFCSFQCWNLKRRRHVRDTRHQIRLDYWQNNPKICEVCKNAIPFGNHSLRSYCKMKACSDSCREELIKKTRNVFLKKYYQKNRVKIIARSKRRNRSLEGKKRDPSWKICIIDGKLLPKKRRIGITKTCSEECSKILKKQLVRKAWRKQWAKRKMEKRLKSN